MATDRQLVDSDAGVELWRLSLRAAEGAAAYLVKDAHHVSPEEWLFDDRASAQKVYNERVTLAKGEPR